MSDNATPALEPGLYVAHHKPADRPVILHVTGKSPCLSLFVWDYETPPHRGVRRDQQVHDLDDLEIGFRINPHQESS